MPSPVKLVNVPVIGLLMVKIFPFMVKFPLESVSIFLTSRLAVIDTPSLRFMVKLFNSVIVAGKS